jgi:hypothetical protein
MTTFHFDNRANSYGNKNEGMQQLPQAKAKEELLSQSWHV